MQRHKLKRENEWIRNELENVEDASLKYLAPKLQLQNRLRDSDVKDNLSKEMNMFET